ncbi:MAG: hypothetical protein GXP43_03350 [bacterium]|nr:hypothetical protein [bacterium]
MKDLSRLVFLSGVIGLVIFVFGAYLTRLVGQRRLIKSVSPAVWLDKNVQKAKDYLIKQRSLVLENERLRSEYSRMVNNCSFQKDKNHQPGWEARLPSRYGFETARIILVRGSSLVAEPAGGLAADEGMAVFGEWLVGRWKKTGDYQAVVSLWISGRLDGRVKITDEKGNFISEGVLSGRSGRLRVKKVLRGVRLKGGELVWFLSGRYDGLPLIGRLSKQSKTDNVYQTWEVETPWKDLIRVDRKLLLVFNKN